MMRGMQGVYLDKDGHWYAFRGSDRKIMVEGNNAPTCLFMLSSINAARAVHGQPDVVLDDALDTAADAWAAHLAATGTLSHGDFAHRISAAVPNVPAGEAIAEGRTTAEATVADWMADPMHRAILLGDFNIVGCGVARDAGGTAWWVADFALVNPPA